MTSVADGRPWWKTGIPALHADTGEGAAMERLLGWPGIVPLSVLRTVMPTATAEEQPSPGRVDRPPGTQVRRQ
ncbi:hypothetical protein DN402_08790 [Streptomyces sp. SW4]|nr:hypothetical protein DN402_08790 [Streptomyces sp. SW4]